jgi:hypothetical protein
MWEEGTGGRLKLHNEELHGLYSSPNIIKYDKIKEDGMDGDCSMHGEIRTRLRTKF